jgi:hypothetical protein
VDATGQPEGGDMLYHVENKIYTEEQVKGWFKEVAPKLAELKTGLKDKNGNWTALAQQLDSISMEDFLKQLENDGTDKRLITIFRQSYISEVGNNSDKISALNFVDCVNPDTSKFEPFGVSDEAYKIEGGTQALTDALQKKCAEMGVKFNYNEPVKRLEREGERAVVVGENSGSQSFDHVVLATSLPSLKHIGGLENVGFSSDQKAWLNSMQHINAVKIGIPTKGDAWKNCSIPSDGSFISDSSFQCSWAVSSEAAQLASPSAPAPHGMVVMLVGGVDEKANIPELVEKCKADYAKVIGKPMDEIFDNTIQPQITVSRSDKNGCYVSPAPGQYIALSDICAKQPDGPASLVGSHVPVPTEIGSKLGFMECGASSAHEQALAIAQDLRKRKSVSMAQQLQEQQPSQGPVPRQLGGDYVNPAINSLVNGFTGPARTNGPAR